MKWWEHHDWLVLALILGGFWIKTMTLELSVSSVVISVILGFGCIRCCRIYTDGLLRMARRAT